MGAQDALRILVVEPDAARAERARQALVDAGLGEGVEIVRDDAEAAARFMGEGAAIIPAHARGYRFLIDALPQIVWVSANDGRILHANPRWWAYTGATLDETLQGSAWTRIVHPDDLETVLADRGGHLASGSTWEFEVRLRRASDGAYCWHLVRELPIRDAGGTLLSWLGTAFDIEDVHRAREVRVLLSNVVASSDDAIITKSLDGIVTSWNLGAERLFGYTAEEMIGRSITTLLPADSDPAEVLAILAEIREGHRIDHFVTRRRHKDGRILDVSLTISPLRDSTGRVVGASSIKRDVTEQHRARELIRVSEERFRLMADASPNLVWTSDPAGSPTYYNQRWCEYAGLAPGESFTLAHWAELVHPADAEAVSEAWRNAVRDGSGYVGEYRLRRLPDGPWRWHLARAHPVRSRSGEVLHWIGTSTDIDDQKRAEEQLREQTTDLEARVTQRTHLLEEMVAEMDTFIYSVSHDLRAPLRAMQGYADALRDDFGERLGAEGHDYLRQIGVSSRLMDRMITDLLTLSRLRHTEVVATPVALPALVSRVLTGMEQELQRTGADVTVDVPDDTPRVLGHETTVLQVLQNLLSNAVKFRAPGAVPRIRIAAEAEPDVVRVWVEDQGIGIAPEHHGQIFRVFERLHRRDQFPGTGVGLAIVQKAVERLGGRIGVESVTGEGSRFWFELPRSHPSRSAPLDGAYSAAAG